MNKMKVMKNLLEMCNGSISILFKKRFSFFNFHNFLLKMYLQGKGLGRMLCTDYADAGFIDSPYDFFSFCIYATAAAATTKAT